MTDQPTTHRMVRVVKTPRLRNGDFSEDLRVGDVVRVVSTDEDGDLVVERMGWNDYLSVAPEYVTPWEAAHDPALAEPGPGA